MTSVIVLGAGMVGVSTALALQEKGHDVVLVDHGPPGRETSYGNAGIIQAEAVEPYAMPRNFAGLLSIALERGNDVRYRLSALPGQGKALWHYFLASHPYRYREISASYAPMIRQATADHQSLITAAGAENLIRRDGFYQILRSPKDIDTAALLASRLSDTYGVASEMVSEEELQRREPALRPGLAGAIRWADPWTCSDPCGLVTAYAALFNRRGGQIREGDAAGLTVSRTGWSLPAGVGQVEAEHAVVALGPWAPEFLRRFGYRFLMIYKRGYHRHFANTGGLKLTLHDPQFGMVVSPMRAGVRITTGAEIAPDSAPATPVQLLRAAENASRLIKLGDAIEPQPWMGRRPCLPGMLPFVGRLPNHRNLWGNFGHGHQGFTLGPTTGKLLSHQLS